MKLKMSENSLFAILLRAPWWISLLVVAVIVLASGALLPAAYVPFGVMGALPFLGIALLAAWRQRHAPNPARVAELLGQAAAMSWRDFSALIEAAFQRQGYVVTRLSHPGADLQLLKNARITLLSCKRWKAANTGVQPFAGAGVSPGDAGRQRQHLYQSGARERQRAALCQSAGHPFDDSH